MRLDSVETGASGLTKIVSGEIAIFVRNEFWARLGRLTSRLLSGVELDEDESIDLVVAAKATEAEARGASLLGRAEQPRFLLRAKLVDRGYPAMAVDLALDRLEAEGFLSDRRYAEAWVRSRVERAVRAGNSSRSGTARAEGPSSLFLSLRARSVSETEAKAAIASVLDDETRRTLLAAAIARISAQTIGGHGGRGEGDSLFGALRELGWKGEDIREALAD